MPEGDKGSMNAYLASKAKRPPLGEKLALLNTGPKRTGVRNYTTNLVKNIPRQQWDLQLLNFSVFGSRAFSAYPSAEKCTTTHGLQLGPLGTLGLPINYLSYRMGSLRRSLERAGRFSLSHATTGDLNHLAGGIQQVRCHVARCWLLQT